MKKQIIITIILILTTLFSPVSIGALAYEGKTLMYDVKGNTAYIPNSQLDAHHKIGGYYAPVMLMYSPEGYTVIPKNEYDSYKAWGWYDYPVVALNSRKGKTIVVAQSEASKYKSAGWYEPVVMMYSPDGTINVMKSEVLKYKGYGWSDCPVIRMYSKSGEETVAPCYLKEEYKKQGWLEAYEYFLGKSYAWMVSKYGNLPKEYYWNGGNFFRIPNANIVMGFDDGDLIWKNGSYVYCKTVHIASMYDVYPELVAQSYNGCVSVNIMNSYFGQNSYIHFTEHNGGEYNLGYDIYSKITNKSYTVIFLSTSKAPYIPTKYGVEVFAN